MNTGEHMVSVIVPIYNVGRYLEQCLESLHRQEGVPLEVICVNDGSTDDSPRTAHRFAELDDRFRVIDKGNEGYGASCDRGIDEARGDWIAVCEPDDWVEPGMYRDLVDLVDRHGGNGFVDIAESAYWRITDPDTPDERRLACSYRGRIRPRRQPFGVADGIHLLLHHPSIWTAIYRKAFLDEKGIRFPKIPGAGWADNPFLVETLCQTERIIYTDRAYYCYREDTAEQAVAFAKRNPVLPLERWNDMVDIMERIGVRDERIWRAQNKRGLTYAGTSIEAVGLDDPALAEACRRSFARMDPGLVLGDRELSPSQKRLFCRLTGRPAPTTPDIAFLPELVRQALYHVRNNGPAYVAGAARMFLAKDHKRAAEK